MLVRTTAPRPRRTFRFDQLEAFYAAFLTSIDLFPTPHRAIPHAAQDSGHFDQTGIAIGRAPAQYARGAMLGDAKSAENHRNSRAREKRQD
jgi:hypothetical protein